MIKLEKDGREMEVRTQLQASAFLNNGWKVKTDAAQNVVSAGENEHKEYKKSDIQRMNVDDLKALATELGIEVTDESTGAKLKEEIIAKLGL